MQIFCAFLYIIQINKSTTQIINKVGISYFTYKPTNDSIVFFLFCFLTSNTCIKYLHWCFFFHWNICLEKRLLLIMKYFHARQIYLINTLLTWFPDTVCVSMTEIMPGRWPLSRGGESAFLGAEGVFAPVTLWTMASPNIVKPLNAPWWEEQAIANFKIS